MREDGDLGEILVVQGTYSQDWLLYDTDWTAGIQSQLAVTLPGGYRFHWCDMASTYRPADHFGLCRCLNVHKVGKQPRGRSKPFGKDTTSETISRPDRHARFRCRWDSAWGDRAPPFTASQVSAGRKNRLNLESYGTKCGLLVGPGTS